MIHVLPDEVQHCQVRTGDPLLDPFRVLGTGAGAQPAAGEQWEEVAQQGEGGGGGRCPSRSPCCSPAWEGFSLPPSLHSPSCTQCCQGPPPPRRSMPASSRSSRSRHLQWRTVRWSRRPRRRSSPSCRQVSGALTELHLRGSFARSVLPPAMLLGASFWEHKRPCSGGPVPCARVAGLVPAPWPLLGCLRAPP